MLNYVFTQINISPIVFILLQMTRSSPVVTRPPLIRHYSAQSIRRDTTRVILRERKLLKDPLMEEVEAFWKIVKRYYYYKLCYTLTHTRSLCVS